MDRGKPLLSDRDGVRTKLVRGDSLWRKALLLQQLSKQSSRRSSAASPLDQKVEHFTLVVDRPPQPVFPAANLDRHLIEMPASAGSRTTAAKIACDLTPELQKPAPDRLIRNIDPTLGEHFLDVAKRQSETGVEPDRVLNDCGRKSMSFE